MQEGRDYVVCQVCYSHFRRITHKHLNKHGMTLDEYQEMFPDAKMMSDKSLMKLSLTTKKRYEDPKEREKASIAAVNSWSDSERRIQASLTGIKKWQDREYRDVTVSGMLSSWEDTDRKERGRIGAIRRWDNQIERDRASIRASKRYEDPRERLKTSLGSSKRYEDPKERLKTSLAASKRYEDPNERLKMSLITIKLYEDSDYRDRRIAAIRKFHFENPGYFKMRHQNIRWNKQVAAFIEGCSIKDFMIGGSTNNYGITLNDYNIWRWAVYERDNYTCQICGLHDREIHAHHIIPKRNNSELILDINNGITLCRECHITTYRKEELFIEELTMIVNGTI